MQKLKLQLEQLRVETFVTDAGAPARGTVLGATGGNTCMTCVNYTGCRADNSSCYHTCVSCGRESCACYSVDCPNYPEI